MAKIRKFELDALTSTIQEKIDKNNEGIEVSPARVENYIKDNFHEVVKVEELNQKIKLINAELQNLHTVIGAKYGTFNQKVTYGTQKTRAVRHTTTSLRTLAKNNLKSEYGFIDISPTSLENKIILYSGTRTLEEVEQKVCDELNIKTKK